MQVGRVLTACKVKHFEKKKKTDQMCLVQPRLSNTVTSIKNKHEDRMTFLPSDSPSK